MKFAFVNLHSATTFLGNGFKFFDDNILYDDQIFNIWQCAFNRTEDY